MRKLIKSLRKKFKNEKGATAVEFALLAAPFLFLVFALVELMVIFFIQTALEAAVSTEARKIRTGQAQGTISQSQFKTNVCGHLYGMADCATRLFVAVETYATPPATVTTPWADNDLVVGSASDEPYQASNAGDIVIVRAYYVWPLLVPGLTIALKNFSNGAFGVNNRILVATTAFKNEPFQ